MSVRMLKKRGVYLYGIIEADANPCLDCDGIGRPPQAVQVKEVAGFGVLVSYLTADFKELGLADSITHVKVLETAMRHSPVIPLKFGTVLKSLDDLSLILNAKKNNLKKEFQKLKGKFEVTIKAYWKQSYILNELAKRYQDIEFLAEQAQFNRLAAIELGKRVESVIEDLRLDIYDRIHGVLSKLAAGQYLAEPLGVEMIYNAAFLVTEEQELRLKRQLEEIAEWEQENVEFYYSTQLPPFNFTKLNLS